MIKREDLRIRDPFILTDTENNCYYMYGTTSLVENSIEARNSFSVYKTLDLENFEEPKLVVDGSKYNFWGTRDFWAAEVHKYNGKYYLLGSCKADGKCRGTHIFVCDTPDGEFVPVSPTPATPLDWECLDGTLYVEDGIPYIVFCHEWLQVGDGEICAQTLSKDLSTPIGEPFILFHASDNKNVTEIASPKGELGVGSGNYVTDGPFLFKEDGKLKMIWSSFSYGRYLVLEAVCKGEKLSDGWEHHGSRFEFDGGHAMLFNCLDGTRMISLHRPNSLNARPIFIEF